MAKIDYSAMDKEQLLDIIESLEKRVKLKKYGIVWDYEKVPEDVVTKCENNAPILISEDKKDITVNDSDDNVLIIGENYLSLQCLSYTHCGSVDLIYIDPPYNTGNNDFVYNDKFIDKEDGYRHSKWLNFMEKRLRIAQKLLKDEGMIFISIDDNELFQLKLLCDQIFGEDNYVNTISVNSKVSAGASGGGEDKKLKKNIEYLLFYSKNINSLVINPIYKETKLNAYIKNMKDQGKSFKYINVLYEKGKSTPFKIIKDGKGGDIHISKVTGYVIKTVKQIAKIENITEEEVYLKYYDRVMTTTNAQTSIRTRVWEATDSENNMYLATYTPRTGKNKDKKTDLLFMGTQKVLVIWLKDTCTKVKHKIFKKEKIGTYWDGFSWINVTKEGGIKFDNGKKPINLIKQLISIHSNKDALILDFFAGSGSTGHAVLSLNEEDGGNRKFVLCTNNEVKNSKIQKYCDENKITLEEYYKKLHNKNTKIADFSRKNGLANLFTYPRLKNVILGHKVGKTTTKGLSSNLKVFKSDTMPLSNINSITDKDRMNMTLKAGDLISLKESTFVLLENNEWYQIYTNRKSNKFTAIYFKEDLERFDELVNKIGDNNCSLYIYSTGKIDKEIFAYLDNNIIVKDIPQPILEIYVQVYKNVRR